MIPLLLWCSSLFPLTSQWTLDLNGNWSTGTPANWSAGVPNAVDDVAQFLGAITAARIVSLSQATTVGTLQFNNANQYTLQSNVLTFQSSTGNGQITVSGGSHQISSNVALASPLTLNNNAPATTFTLSGAISGTGGITLSGTSGDVTFSGATANTFTGLTTMNSAAGTLNLSKAGNTISIAGDLTITAGTVHVTAAEQISNTSTVLVNGGTFQVDAVSLTFGELSFQSGTLNFAAGATITLTDSVTALSLGNGTNPTYPLAFTGTGAILLDQPSGSSANLDSNLDLGSNTREINIPNFSVNQLDVGGILSGSGGIIKTGPGILNFDGGAVTNTFTGVTDIVQGLVVLSRAAGSTSLSGNVFINGGQLNHGASQQIADTSTMIIQAGEWQLGGFTETIDRLDFIAGTFVSSPAGQLNLLSNGTALQMSGGTALVGGNVTLSGTGQVVFDPSLGGTATIGNLDLGGNAHPFNIGNGSGDPDMTISGILSNGDLIKIGAGNLLLSGSSPNTYGTTTLNAGTLTLAKNPGVSAVSGTVTMNGGTLLTQNSNQFGAGVAVTLNSGTFTMGGTTQNFGTLNDLGGSAAPFSGILELTNAANMLTMRNTQLTGNLALQAGGGKVFFDATNNGTAVLNGMITINGATADFDIADGTATSDMVIYSVISGNGLIKSGPGTLYLLGANTYSGGTTILAGTLKGNTVSLSGNIANSGVVEFDQPFDAAFNGTLSGQGNLIKSGGGNLTFNTPQALGGTVTIQGGTFTVNSQFNNDLPGTGALTLNQGATLSGTGSIQKNIIASGTVSPGDHSIGTLTTGGNVSMNGGSTLLIELTSSTNDLLNVGGTFTVAPNGEFFFNPLADVYVEPLAYTVVQAAGGVVGTYTRVHDPFPLIQGSLHYFTNSIVLNLEFLPISNLLGLSGNAQKVAHCLDARNPPPGSDLYYVINSLRLVDHISSIEKSLLSMQPSMFTSLAVLKQSSTLYFRDTIYDRFEIYTRSCMAEKQTFYIWATPFLSFAEENNHGKQVGYHSLTSGVAIGLDGFLFKELQVGGALGYSHSALDWKQFRGTARVHGIYGALYGKYQGEIGYLESAVIIGYDYYSTQRNIKIRGLLPIHRSALGRHHGFESSGHLKGALRLAADHTQIAPFLSFDYLYQYEGDLSEHGADSLNLKISFKHANLFVSELGMDLAHCLDLTRNILTPHISVSGIWEKRINGGYEKSSFGGCPIDVYGYYPSRLLVGSSAGFDVKWPLKNALQASFQYKGKYGRGYQDHSFNLVLMY